MLEGTARITHELATHLAERGQNIIAVTDGPRRNLALINRDYEIGTIGQRFSFMNVFLLSDFITRAKPDIVHFHGGEVMSLYAMMFKFISSLPTVFTFTHTPSVCRKSVSFPRSIPLSLFSKSKPLEAMSTQRFNHIIALSQFAGNSLVSEHAVDPHKLSIIPYGVPEEFLAETSISNTSLEGDNDTIYIGDTSALRGFHAFLSAVSIVKHRMSGVNFLVSVRHDNELAKFKKLIQGLSIITPNKLYGKLDSASIVVIPFSKCVAVDPPLSVLESMARGKAIVTSPIGSVPEIVGLDRGVLVEQCTPGFLAAAILNLMRNQKLKKSIGKNARQYIMEKYDWNIAMNSIMDIYRYHAH